MHLEICKHIFLSSNLTLKVIEAFLILYDFYFVLYDYNDCPASFFWVDTWIIPLFFHFQKQDFNSLWLL